MHLKYLFITNFNYNVIHKCKDVFIINFNDNITYILTKENYMD